MPQKKYATPAIETLDSSEILDMIGPVQGYGFGGGGAHGGIISSPVPSMSGEKTPGFNN